MEKKDLKEQLVQQDNKEYLVLLARKVLKDLLVQQVMLVIEV